MRGPSCADRGCTRGCLGLQDSDMSHQDSGKVVERPALAPPGRNVEALPARAHKGCFVSAQWSSLCFKCLIMNRGFSLINKEVICDQPEIRNDSNITFVSIKKDKIYCKNTHLCQIIGGLSVQICVFLCKSRQSCSSGTGCSCVSG